MPLSILLAREYFGLRILGTVFGAATLVSSLGMALGPTSGGWIFDVLRTYQWLYVFSFAVGLGPLRSRAGVFAAAPGGRAAARLMMRDGRLLSAPSCR